MGSWPRDQWISQHWLDYALVVALVGTPWRTGASTWLRCSGRSAAEPARLVRRLRSVHLTGRHDRQPGRRAVPEREGHPPATSKTRHPDELSGTWKSIFYGSILAAALILTANTGQDTGSGVGSWLYETAALLALLRLLRLVALFGDLVDIIVRDETTPLEHEPLDLNPAFFEEATVADRADRTSDAPQSRCLVHRRVVHCLGRRRARDRSRSGSVAVTSSATSFRPVDVQSEPGSKSHDAASDLWEPHPR